MHSVDDCLILPLRSSSSKHLTIDQEAFRGLVSFGDAIAMAAGMNVSLLDRRPHSQKLLACLWFLDP